MQAENGAGILLCLCGPAGVGKTVLGKRLLEANPISLQRSISLTSRASRSSEQSGVSYHFVDKETFQEKIASGVLLEWEQVHGHFYGTLRSSVEDCLKSAKDLLLIIDIKGCLKVRSAYPKNAIVVFVAPPAFSELSSRMRTRGETDGEAMAARLETARSELKMLAAEAAQEGATRIDYLLVNNDIESCYRQLQAILQAERARLRRYSPEFLEKISL